MTIQKIKWQRTQRRPRRSSSSLTLISIQSEPSRTNARLDRVARARVDALGLLLRPFFSRAAGLLSMLTPRAQCRGGISWTNVSGSEPILGLDLGTAKACVSAVDQDGRLRLLADQRGDTAIPACVSFHPDGNVLVGREAVVRQAADPDNTLWRQLWAPNATVITRAGKIEATSIDGILLDHMRRLADAALRTDSRRVVLTVPWGYNDHQRQVLVRGARTAGLDIVDILPCPVAAAYAYGLGGDSEQQFVVVCDFGKSKFECSVLNIEDGRPKLVASIADMELGGDDITSRITHWMVQGFREDHQIDLWGDPVAMDRFRLAAEQSKLQLSSASDYGVRVEVPSITFDSDGKSVGLQLLLTWDLFNRLTDDLVDRALRICDRVLDRARLQPERIAQVLAVGGSLRLAPLRNRLGAFFGRAARMDVDPEAACALGAALYAPERAVVSDRITSPYGAVSAPPDSESSPAMLAARSTRVGRVITKKMFTAVMPAQVPDAALDATSVENQAIVEKFGDDTVRTQMPAELVEVTAWRLALSTVGGYCDEIIGANVVVPTTQTRVFATSKDRQETVILDICQGDSRKFAANMKLGRLMLVNLPQRPRGDLHISVTFDIDEDGVLTAAARDEATGQERSIRIDLPSRAETSEAT